MIPKNDTGTRKILPAKKKYTGGAHKNWMTPNEGGKDLLHTQYVANKYFDTVELKRPRASIILTKNNNCLQHIGAVGGCFCPR